MKHALVTGATGFVGSNLVRKLLLLGHDVHLLVRSPNRAWRLNDILSETHVHQCDLREAHSVQNIVKRVKPDWIFHLAVYGAYPQQTDFQTMVDTNLVGTANLLEAAIKTGFLRFIHTGSSSEYGSKAFAPPETEPPAPNSYYAISKTAATTMAGWFARDRDLPITTLRLYSVYGPFEEPTRLIPNLLIKGLKGTLPPLANPQSAHDFVFIDDVVDAYTMVASCSSERLEPVYNIGTGKQTKLAEIVEVVRRLLSIAEEPAWGSMPPRPWDTETWRCDNRKIGELGWVPRHTLEEGLTKILHWFTENDRYWHKYYESIEHRH